MHMTTITLDEPIILNKTHFSTSDDLIKSLLQAEFETKLEKSYQKSLLSPDEDFVNL